MNLNQLNIPDNLKSFKNIDENISESSKSIDLSGVIASNSNKTENHLLLRLQEMEELNAYLEKLVEKSTRKLNDSVATNTKFLTVIAHDLRSPVSSILSVMELIKVSLNYNKLNEIDNFINIAYKSANTTLSLLDDLMEWAISQTTEKSFNPVKINLHWLVNQEIENIDASAKQKHILLNHYIEHDLNVAADLQMVKTILRNLISNSVKYTKTGGEITISASESNQFVEITVKDNGIGISQETQGNLFKIDEVHSTTGTNNEKGTGLGLLLCKEFVEIHGGNIRIESEPGNGCEFKFTLPHYI